MAVRIAKWLAIAIAALAGLIIIALLAINTGPGKRFIASRLGSYSTAAGLNFRTSRIDGSLYGRMVLHDVEVRDTQGAFATIPELTVDWRPFAYLHSKIDVRELIAPTATLIRRPALKTVPSDPNAPILPDIDLALGRLRLDRLDILPAVTGRRHRVRLRGSANIASGRAQIALAADALIGRGITGGDRLRLTLDAVPAANRFALDADLAAPEGGLIESYAGLGKPLVLQVHGRGDWANWRGRLSGALGGQPLAGIDVTGSNGRFEAAGALRPALLLTGPAAHLVQPSIRIRAVTVLAERKADTRLDASSDALVLHAAGLIDLGNSRFGGFHIGASLNRPGAFAPNIRARDLRFDATLDGPFITPTIDYRMNAAEIGAGTLFARDVKVTGKGKVDTNRLLIPVHASAGAVSGLNAAVGGLLTHVRLDGDVAYQNGKLASDNLRLRSDRIDATAIILADLTHGTYAGALKGRVNDYEVNGLGRLTHVTDAHLVPGTDGGFAVRGRVKAVTRRIENAGLRDQLGGNALITADVGYDLAGGATVRNLRLSAPKFRIVAGDGFYRPDGRIGLKARGASASYGAFALDVSGTLAKPLAHLRAGRPGLGIGLAALEATLEGAGGAYRVLARGQSDYGPFALDALYKAEAAGARIDLRSATIAGIHVAGRLTQTQAGPFAGKLTLNGSGISGNVRLAAEGSVQRADLDLRAAGARLPGQVPITIASGTAIATIRLPAGGPAVTGRFALTGLSSGSFSIDSARGRVDYAQGTGRVALVAAGQAQAAFRIATQAALSPARIVANVRGTVSGVAVSLAAPAVLTKAGTDWQLQPTTLVTPQGRMQLSGRFGRTTELHAWLQNLDLAVLNAFLPDFGVGGKASGTVDLSAAGAVPDVRARVDVAGLTRTSALTVSEPVDVALLATLGAGGGDARAIVRRGGAIVGRVQARLAPLGAGAGLMERLMSAPLSGGIRYNGPAEVLWTLSGIAHQDLTGPIAIGVDFGGRLDRPALTGVVRANALRYENETFGTVLSKLAIDGQFTQSQLLLNRLTATAGRGTIAASGRVGLDAASGFPIDLKVRLDRAQLARGDDLDATISGTIAVTNSKGAGGLIKGDLSIPEARYQIVRQGAASVPELTGVRRKGAPPPSAANDEASLPSNWKLDVRLRADNRIFVSGMGLEAEWRTDMTVSGTSRTPSIVGRLEVVRGTYSFAGRRLDIDHGIITFRGGLTNPALDIAASTTIEGVSTTIAIGGYAERPQISFTSTPALPQDEVLSRLLFGTSVTSLSPTQAIQLAAALNSLRGSGGGLNPLGKLRGVAGVDRLRVLGADQSAGRGTALAAGKYISNNIYVEIVTDARGFTATQLEISLSKALSVLSQTSSFGGSNVSLRYKKVY